MTDVEISKALALAIGWKRILPNVEAHALKQCWVWTGGKWRLFDYRDWRVIGPIAKSYDCFPYKMHGKWDVMNVSRYYDEDTPQKAIALALIEGSKK